MQNKPAPAERRRKIISILGLAAIAVLLIVCSVVLGERAKTWLSDPSAFRDWAQSKGFSGKLAMIAINMVQVVLAFIPGEPVEIAAGIAFGPWQGMLLVLCGTVTGTCLIFLLTKKLGMRFVEMFVARETVEALPIFQKPRRLDALVFLLFFIPGTPKDVLTYAVGFTPMPLWRFLLLSTIARMPSVISSTVGGGALGTQKYGAAIWIFAVTALVSVVGLLVYRHMQGNKG